MQWGTGLAAESVVIHVVDDIASSYLQQRSGVSQTGPLPKYRTQVDQSTAPRKYLTQVDHPLGEINLGEVLAG
ncbi:MAG: hypothetical protein ABUL67_00120 [Haliangium ochraceum]